MFSAKYFARTRLTQRFFELQSLCLWLDFLRYFDCTSVNCVNFFKVDELLLVFLDSLGAVTVDLGELFLELTHSVTHTWHFVVLTPHRSYVVLDDLRHLVVRLTIDRFWVEPILSEPCMGEDLSFASKSLGRVLVKELKDEILEVVRKGHVVSMWEDDLVVQDIVHGVSAAFVLEGRFAACHVEHDTS